MSWIHEPPRLALRMIEVGPWKSGILSVLLCTYAYACIYASIHTCIHTRFVCSIAYVRTRHTYRHVYVHIPL